MLLASVSEIDESALASLASEEGLNVGWGPEWCAEIESIGVVITGCGELRARKWFDTQFVTDASPTGLRSMMEWLRREERASKNSLRPWLDSLCVRRRLAWFRVRRWVAGLGAAAKEA